MDNTQTLNSLPPPPKGQIGVSPDSFSNLPPPPAGQSGKTLQQVVSEQQIQPQQKNDLLNNPITRGIQNIFPGKEVGQAIGTLGGYLASPNKSTYDTSAPSPLQVGGDIAQGALTVAAPNIGNGATALGRIAANTALGAGLGGTNAIAQGNGIKDVAKNTAIGGALSGGISAGGELTKYLTENMPRWFTKIALPKLSQSKINGAPQDTINYALNNSKGATLRTMYNNSNDAVKSYENQIQATLAHPNYTSEVGSKDVVKNVIGQFGNAELTPDKIVNYIKKVAPQNSALADKIANGTATLAEQNTLRKELDMATKTRFTDTPKLTFAKQIGGAIADALRSNVQKTASETAPIFKEYSKEIQLNKALGNALAKKRVAGPLVAGAGGFAAGGLKGAAEAIAVEEGIRSPTAKLLAAKGINTVGKVANPLIQGAVAAGKAPLTKLLTNSQEKIQSPQVGAINPLRTKAQTQQIVSKATKGVQDLAMGFGPGAIGSVESVAAEKFAQNLSTRDRGIMEKFISYARSPKSAAHAISDVVYNGAERIARKSGGNLDKGLASLANHFENILGKAKNLGRK